MFASSERMSYKYKKRRNFSSKSSAFNYRKAQGLKINALFILRIPDSTHKTEHKKCFFLL